MARSKVSYVGWGGRRRKGTEKVIDRMEVGDGKRRGNEVGGAERSCEKIKDKAQSLLPLKESG